MGKVEARIEDGFREVERVRKEELERQVALLE